MGCFVLATLEQLTPQGICSHTCKCPLYANLHFSLSGTSSVSEGKRGSTVQIVSTFDGTFTAGPCMHLCLPEGKATIFMNGTCKDINRSSSKFKPESRLGIGHSCNQLALACNGMLPLFNAALQVLQTHCLPSELM